MILSYILSTVKCLLSNNANLTRSSVILLMMPVINKKLFFIIITTIAFIVMPMYLPAFAEDIKKIEEEIKKTQNDLKETESSLSKIQEKANNISSTISKLSGNLNLTNTEIDALKKDLSDIDTDIKNLNQKMEIKKENLDTQTEIRNTALKDLYMNDQKSIIELVLSNKEISTVVENAAYYLNFINTTEYLIGSINGEINRYETDKKEIEKLKAQVESEKANMEKLVAQLANQVKSAKSELAQISQKQQALEQEKASIKKKLSELSAKQSEILGEKTETFSTSVGDVPTTGDPNSRADFNPGFKKAFAGFSFGAPHRKGMSQYGAKGRAESGQSAEEILKAYYGDVQIVEMDGLPKNITTDKGSMELDGKYLKGLGEMPSSWPKEALKAQAIAARTYALAYVGWRVSDKNANGKICTSENCQVWVSSKASTVSAWHDAVNSTKTKVLVSKKTGEIFSALYAATSGGYNYSYSSLGHTTKANWDTKCTSKDCWTSDAYESKGGSPWFYKGWYKSRSGKTCSRIHPWLTEVEFADIVGAMVLYQKDKNNQKHLSQVDAKSCWGESIDGTWSRDEVKEKSGITSVSDVDVTYSSGGYTSSVKIKTNKGDMTFDGDDFKAIFNLRAPGVITLKSALFNIEVKK